jgi:hypothetical protein
MHGHRPKPNGTPIEQYDEGEESTGSHGPSQDLPVEPYKDDDEVTRPVP